MVCSKCGQELYERVKYCTKCGASFNFSLKSQISILSYFSIILSIIGLIGLNILNQKLISTNYNDYETSIKIISYLWIFRLIIFSGITVAMVALYKQKSKFGFITGLIPCGYYILVILTRILPFLGFLTRIIAF